MTSKKSAGVGAQAISLRGERQRRQHSHGSAAGHASDSLRMHAWQPHAPSITFCPCPGGDELMKLLAELVMHRLWLSRVLCR